MLRRDVDEAVVAAAAHTPFEAAHRIFVLERADVMNDEAANALLKTLEEPPSYVVLLLLTDRPTQVLPTIASRCQAVRFDPPGDRGSSRSGSSRQGVPPETAEAAARLSLGDANKALALALGDGPALRAAAESLARAPLQGTTGTERPGGRSSSAPGSAGQAAKEEVEAALVEELQYLPKKEHKRRETEFTERARRADRRAATQALDHALQLTGLWYRDLAASPRACLSWRSTPIARDALSEDAGRDEPSAAPGDGAGRRHARPPDPQRQRGAGLRGARLPLGGGALLELVADSSPRSGPEAVQLEKHGSALKRSCSGRGSRTSRWSAGRGSRATA